MTKQTEIPGAERPCIPALDKLIKKHEGVLTERCKLSTKEAAARQEIDDWMKKHREDLEKNKDGDVIYVAPEHGQVYGLTRSDEKLTRKKWKAPAADETDIG